MKITENLGEFQKFIEDDSKTGTCLEDTLGFFDIQRIFGQFESVKQSGIRVTLIMTTLLVMLFYRNRNIHSYFSRQYGKHTDRDGSKNPYYDLLGNEYISWRSILYLYAKRYLNLSGRITDYYGKIKALIFDDSPTEKRGKKIEGAYLLIFPYIASGEISLIRHGVNATGQGGRQSKLKLLTRSTESSTWRKGQY